MTHPKENVGTHIGQKRRNSSGRRLLTSGVERQEDNSRLYDDSKFDSRSILPRVSL
jgi:hypothetical protein